MSLLARSLVLLTSPLGLIDVRSERLERLLGLPLTKENVESLRAVPASSNIGRFYHWYLQKMIVARAIRGLDKVRASDFIAAIDRTDYAPVDSLIESRSGALVAIPHHAHYILTMTALAAYIGRHRKVKVFYASPAKNKGNAVFDHLHSLLFSDPDCGVEIIHNTRQGLARAISGLKNGDIVFIMPDAYEDVTATMMLPFCGRLTNVMLGTAVLARKTGSWILPVVSRKVGLGLAFSTHFGRPIYPSSANASLTAEQDRIANYAVMLRVFAQFEEVMASELLLWQNLRQHFENGVGVHDLVPLEQIESAVDELRSSPWLRKADLVLDLRDRKEIA